MTPLGVSALTVIIPLVVLVSLRVGVAFALMPAPFGSLAPVQVRVGLGVLIALALCVPQLGLAAGVPDSLVGLGRAAVGEVLVGSVIGLTVRVIIAAVEIAGTWIGFSTGLAFASSVDPSFGESMPPTGTALSALAVAIFLALQGHHAVLVALAASLDLAPPGASFVVLAHDGVLTIGAGMMAHGLRIAAPVVATMFIVQLGTALVSRAAPRVHLFALTFAIAVSVGLLALFISIPSMMPPMAAEVRALPDALLRALGGGL